MNDTTNTTIDLDQTEEKTLIYEVSEPKDIHQAGPLQRGQINRDLPLSDS